MACYNGYDVSFRAIETTATYRGWPMRVNTKVCLKLPKNAVVNADKTVTIERQVNVSEKDLKGVDPEKRNSRIGELATGILVSGLVVSGESSFEPVERPSDTAKATARSSPTKASKTSPRGSAAKPKPAKSKVARPSA